MSPVKRPAIIEENGRLVIDHLSYSGLRVFLQCYYKWFCIYVLKITRPPKWLLPVGGAGHKGLEQNNNAYIATGEYMSSHDLKEYTAEAFDEQMSFNEEVIWDDKKPGEAKDQLIKQVSSYRKREANAVVPLSAEQKWELTFVNVPWKLTGYIDVVAQDKGGEGLIDYKFTNRSMDTNTVENLAMGRDPDPQPLLYAYARHAQGKHVTKFSYHNLVRTKEPKAQVVDVRLAPEMLEAVPNWVSSIASVAQGLLDSINGEPSTDNRGLFYANPKLDPADRKFHCGDGCEYKDLCPLYGGNGMKAVL